MKALIFFLKVVPLLAQPTGLIVIGATNRQAVIAYNAPSAAACLVTLTDGGVAAHDTNNTLFSGANSDLSRASTVTNGRYRIVTLGKPNSDLAADGKMYSRALFAETSYTGAVTCGSGVNFAFVTSAPPVGGIFAEPPPVNTDGWGQHGFPDVDYATTGDYADPLTGVRISPITLADGYVATPADPVLFGSYTGGTGWTNPGNILAYSATTSAQVGNTNPLVVWPSPLDAQSLLSYALLGKRQLLDFGLFGYAGASSATAADRQFTVCLTINGTDCMDGSTTLTAQAVQDADPTTIPLYGSGGKVTPNFPTPMWSDWGKVVPMDHRPNFAQLVDFVIGVGASVDVVAGVVTVSTSGAVRNFQSNVVGKQVFIEDSDPTCARDICTIASWQSGTQVTLAETGLTVSDKSMYLLGFGIKIQKANANGTLNLSLGYKGYAGVGFSSAAAAHTCHPLTFTNFGGERTRLCIIRNAQGNMLYAVTDSRKGYYLGIGMQAGNVVDQPVSGLVELHFDGFTTWNVSDAKSFYVITNTHPTLTKSIFRVDYGGDGTAITNICGTAGGCVYAADSMTWTNLGKESEGENIQARAETACGTQYTNYLSFWGSFDGSPASRGSGNFGAISLTPSGQDGGPGWELIINTADGTIHKCIFTMNDESGIGMRWGSHHAFTGFNYPEGQMLISGNPLGRCDGGSSLKLCGPFESQTEYVWRSGAWSADTSLPWPIPADNTVYDRTCPTDIPAQYTAQIAEANPVGDPLTKCVTIRAKPPCFLGATGDQVTNWPCAWDVTGVMYQLPKAGDYVQDISLPDAPYFPDSERFLLLKDPVAIGDGTYSMVFARNATVESCNPVVGTGSAGQSTHADNWTFMMGVKGADYDKHSCIGAFVVYQGNDQTSVVMGKTMASGHSDFGRPVGTTDATKMSFVTILPGSLAASALADLGNYPPDYFDFAMTGFANTGASGVPTQSYMKRTDTNNTNTFWAIDAGNAAPSGGAVGEDPANNIGTRAMDLQGGTSNVYKIGAIGNLRNEKYAPMWYWAGFYSLVSVSSASTGDIVTDATPYTACRAYKVNECRTGSSVGDIYVSVPNASTSTTLAAGQSYMLSPGATSGFGTLISVFRRGMKQEQNCNYCQILSYAWPTSGVHYPYQQAVTDPDGVMSISSMGGWMNGVFQGVFGYKQPSWTLNSQRGNQYQTRAISVAARSGATHARLRFGRDTDFYCIPSRNEACVTDTVIAPFAWVTSDAPGDPTACDAGCTINLPVTTGVYYFRREWLASDAVVATGRTEVITVN